MSLPKHVYCIIPTHNRLDSLKIIIRYLNNQTYSDISIIVINDGSNDGTDEYLKLYAKNNLIVVNGDGNLWWGGAMKVGMTAALSMAGNSDFILLLNDDCTFANDYIEKLLKYCDVKSQTAIVSPQYDLITGEFSYAGYMLNFYKQSISHATEEPINAAVGRGLLVPVAIVSKIGIINAHVFPHYMGDIEYSARITESNYSLTVAWEAQMYSDLTPSDLKVQQLGIWKSLFHNRSKSNILDTLRLFQRRGPLWTRVTALPRFLIRFAITSIRLLMYKE